MQYWQLPNMATLHYHATNLDVAGPGFPWALWRALVDLGMDPEHAFAVVGP